MSDEQNFPTAIIPTRPEGIERRYDALSKEFGDPLVTVFTLQRDAADERVRLSAADSLLDRRYPRLKAETITHKGAAGGAGGVNIQINFGPAPSPTVNIDSKPLEDLLE